MNRVKRIAGAVLMGGLLMGTLAACSTTSEYNGTSVSKPAPGAWFQSSRGDVYCVYPDDRGVYDVSCDWSNLVASGTHTTSKSKALEIDLLTTKKGTIQCAIVSDASTSTQTPSCDWSSLTPFNTTR